LEDRTRVRISVLSMSRFFSRKPMGTVETTGQLSHHPPLHREDEMPRGNPVTTS
jgi:hypothetical protein